MNITITCPQCRRSLLAPRTHIGRMVRCPGCSTAFAAEDVTTLPPPMAIALELPEPTSAAPPPPAFVPPVRSDDPWSLPAPVGAARRPIWFPPIRFSAAIDPASTNLAGGDWDAVASPEGLSLRRPGTPAIDVPVGTPTRYLGRNFLAVMLAHGEQVVEVTHRGAADRLARDLAAFLSGQCPKLNPGDYQVPVLLQIMAFLPLGIPLIALPTNAVLGGWMAGAIWGGLGGALAGLSLWLGRLHRWPAVLRGSLILGSSAIAYLVLFGLLLGHLFTPKWDPFEPPGGGYQVLMPGKPRPKTESYAPGQNMTMHLVEHRSPDSAYVVSVVVLPQDALDLRISDRERFDGGREGMLAKTPGSRLRAEKDIMLNGVYPGREFIVDVPGKMTLSARMYLVGPRLFLLIAAGPNFTPDHSDVSKFFSSFRLKDTPIGRP